MVKIHLNYTVDEVAELVTVAKVTVRRWIKSGALPALTEKKPTLVLGGDLADFLKKPSPRRAKTLPHECYCFKCRAPRSPALAMAEYVPRTQTMGTLRALCCICSTMMNKAITLSAVTDMRVVLDVTIRPVEQHLVDTPRPPLNDHLPKEPADHA